VNCRKDCRLRRRYLRLSGLFASRYAAMYSASLRSVRNSGDRAVPGDRSIGCRIEGFYPEDIVHGGLCSWLNGLQQSPELHVEVSRPREYTASFAAKAACTFVFSPYPAARRYSSTVGVRLRRSCPISRSLAASSGTTAHKSLNISPVDCSFWVVVRCAVWSTRILRGMAARS